MKVFARHDAYEDGRKARHDGRPRTENPYFGICSHDWREGWEYQGEHPGESVRDSYTARIIPDETPAS